MFRKTLPSQTQPFVFETHHHLRLGGDMLPVLPLVLMLAGTFLISMLGAKALLFAGISGVAVIPLTGLLRPVRARPRLPRLCDLSIAAGFSHLVGAQPGPCGR